MEEENVADGMEVKEMTGMETELDKILRIKQYGVDRLTPLSTHKKNQRMEVINDGD